jgi:hypothetical protein
MLTRLASVGFDAGLLEQHRAGHVSLPMPPPHPPYQRTQAPPAPAPAPQPRPHLQQVPRREGWFR